MPPIYQGNDHRQTSAFPPVDGYVQHNPMVPSSSSYQCQSEPPIYPSVERHGVVFAEGKLVVFFIH